MIIEFLIALAEGVISWFMELLDFELVPQEAVLDVGAGIAPWAHGIYDLGVWIPWSTLAFWVPIVGTAYVSSLFFKFIKNMFSHVPKYGGRG